MYLSTLYYNCLNMPGFLTRHILPISYMWALSESQSSKWGELVTGRDRVRAQVLTLYSYNDPILPSHLASDKELSPWGEHILNSFFKLGPPVIFSAYYSFLVFSVKVRLSDFTCFCLQHPVRFPQCFHLLMIGKSQRRATYLGEGTRNSYKQQMSFCW